MIYEEQDRPNTSNTAATQVREYYTSPAAIDRARK
jgi:hypothetical protein